MRVIEDISAIRMQALESYVVGMIGPLDEQVIAEQFMVFCCDLLRKKI